MNKESFFRLIESMNGSFGATFGAVFLINYAFVVRNNVFLLITIIVCLIGLIYGIKMFRAFGNWNLDLGGWRGYSVLVSILLIFSVFVGTLEIFDDINDRWNTLCEEKGLPNRCTPLEECRKDCLDLGKEYYRYEGGGFFRDTNCWCKLKDKTEQVW